MAKNNGRKVTIAIISLIITVVVIIAGVVYGYAKMEVEAFSHSEDIETLKDEGCLPARQGKTDIELIKKDIEHIRQGVDKLLERP